MTMTQKRAAPTRLAAAAVVALAALTTLPAGAEGHVLGYRDGDLSVVARNILPPGQGEYLNTAELAQSQAGFGQPDHNVDQIQLYENLVAKAVNPLTTADVEALFKDASFGVAPGDEGRT